jgi:hypothetical protein
VPDLFRISSLTAPHYSRARGLRALGRLGALAMLCLGLAAHQPAGAQRTLAPDAKYIAKAQFNYPFVKLGKEVLRLAVGGKIYNEQNLIIMPNTAPRTADVLYKIDTNGEISQIWLLTPEESKAASKRKK